MTTRTWIRKLFARTPRTVRKAPARCRPAVEVLEDRLAPAVLTVNTLDDNLTYTSVLNLREAITLADAMHAAAQAVTDSTRMYLSGVEGGRPAAGEIGISPICVKFGS